jgi:RecB family endonuclease NucS
MTQQAAARMARDLYQKQLSRAELARKLEIVRARCDAEYIDRLTNAINRMDAEIDNMLDVIIPMSQGKYVA